MRLAHSILSIIAVAAILLLDTTAVGATENNSLKNYTGSQQNNVPHGKGTMTWLDGRKYSGDWKNGKHHGYGTYRWPGGEVYRGQWQNNLWHGQGTYSKPDGSIMTGEWRDGNFWNVISIGPGDEKMEWKNGIPTNAAELCQCDPEAN